MTREEAILRIDSMIARCMATIHNLNRCRANGKSLYSANMHMEELEKMEALNMAKQALMIGPKDCTDCTDGKE